ncbi:MAG: hypothetical protein IJ398_05130 [Clostridia bacterium]|nr:hypothetical protein [Clostridia bacterium]
MKLIFDFENKQIVDTRAPSDKIFNGNEISACYTLLSDDITRGEKPSCTPYADRGDALEYRDGEFYGEATKTRLKISEIENGLLFEMRAQGLNLSEYGINLPFNFMGKLDGCGWKNQFLFNSPYTSPDKNIIYFYLTKPNGNNLVVAILSKAHGWKMDYSPYSFGHYFINLKLLASYDRAYGQGEGERSLSFAILPVKDFNDALCKLNKLYGVPFLNCDLNGEMVGGSVNLSLFGECDSIEEGFENIKNIIPFSREYKIPTEGEISLTPIKAGRRGATITLYGYRSLLELYKKSMDSVDLEIIQKYTDGNLCEHQCWASAMLRFLQKHSDMLTGAERELYEGKLLSLLDIITETNEERAVPRKTILNKPHDIFPAYNVYKSRRVQELFFGITILLDAYRYFGDKKYEAYAKGAMECLLSFYQRNDGRLEIDWGNNSLEDYSTVCCPMIPILDMANFYKDKNKELSNKYFLSAKKMAEHLYKRGTKFPTEGCASENAEEEMEDGSISCTALALLYYCKNGVFNEEYLKKAKEILDIHESWVINTPICQMHSSSLRWWETQWEGDGDGPAICAGHAWSIWRAESDYLYYELTGDKRYLIKAKNGFMTNLSKIDMDGKSYAIYNPDLINGGGFGNRCEKVSFKEASRFPTIQDCGMSRYVWIRINDTLLK